MNNEIMREDKVGEKISFHLVEDAWNTLRTEFSRIIGEEEAILVTVFRFSSPSHKMEEESEEERKMHFETPFVKDVKKIVKKIKEKFKAESHIHLHPRHGSVTFMMVSSGELLVDNFRSIVAEASTCEECVLEYLEGEVRIGEEVATLFYGSSANVIFILPAADGRKLKLIEAVMSI
ncbi:MAG: hypothetical protein QXF28_02120 [Nitrososphaerota archaeon]